METKILLRSYVDDVSALSVLILDVLQKTNFSDDSFLSNQITGLINKSNLLTQAIKAEGPASELAAADEKRDMAFRVVYYELKSKMHWYDAQVVAAANMLFGIIEKYGMKTITLAYQLQSASINALLLDFKSADAQAAIALLPEFATLITQLTQAQKDFETTYLQNANKLILAQNTLPATKLKTQVRYQVNQELMPYLHAMAMVNPRKYKVAADLVSTLILESNRKVRNRLSKPKAELAQ